MILHMLWIKYRRQGRLYTFGKGNNSAKFFFFVFTSAVTEHLRPTYISKRALFVGNIEDLESLLTKHLVKCRLLLKGLKYQVHLPLHLRIISFEFQFTIMSKLKSLKSFKTTPFPFKCKSTDKVNINL